MARNRELQKQRQREWYQNNKERQAKRQREKRLIRKRWFYQTFVDGKKCLECGEDDPCTFDFHHLNPEEKDEAIFDMVHNLRTEKRITTEIEKCIILCSNCHRKLHNKHRLNDWK